MTKADYLRTQSKIREFADKHGVAPIIFEDAWSTLPNP